MRVEGSQNTNPTLLWTEDGVIFCNWRGEDSDMDNDLVVTYCGGKVQKTVTVSDVHAERDTDSDDSLADLFIEM